jgi:catechol 2,3-dioxygenase-like lactoylglutathione lyase family enzyme
MSFSITRAGHLEFRVTDLKLARRFYVEVLGLVEVGSDDQRLYLGGLEERQHHSLSLRLAPSPGVTHLAFRVSDPEDLPRLATLSGAGRATRWIGEVGREWRCECKTLAVCRWSSTTRWPLAPGCCSSSIATAAPR